MNSGKKNIESTLNAMALKRVFPREKLVPIVAFAMLCAIIGAINPFFFAWQTWQNIFLQVSNVGIIALGAMFVVTSGGLDFTAGHGVSLAGIYAATIFVSSHMDNTATIVTGLLIGAAMGAVNGFVIVILKIQPFIATLSIMTIIQGLLLFISEGVIIHVDVEGATFTNIGQGIIPFPGGKLNVSGGIQGIPVAFLIFIGLAVITYLLLHKTRFGQATLAMGGNEEAARLAGVKVDWYRFWVYVFAGLMTGVGAVITLARVASIGISLGGTPLLLDVVAAAIIGGTAVSGGRCNVLGVVIGTFIVICITSALIYLNIDANWRGVFKGLVILIAISIEPLADRISISVNSLNQRKLVRNRV